MIAVKKDTLIILVNLLCIVGAFALVYSGKITWPHAEAFVLGLVIPSGLGWKPKRLAPEKKLTSETVPEKKENLS